MKIDRKYWDCIVNNYVNGNKKEAYKLAEPLTASEMVQFAREDREIYGYNAVVQGRLSVIDIIYIAKG